MHRFILPILALVMLAQSAVAEVDKVRLSWRDDPSTTMVIGFCPVKGIAHELRYDTVARSADSAEFANRLQNPVTHVFQYPGENDIEDEDKKPLVSHFFRLSGLQPDTVYYFVIVDSESVSRRFSFRTAPVGKTPFTFIAGGDSRSNRERRRDGNKIVPKLRPLFVLFGGDYSNKGEQQEWRDWLDDWQLTISDDGRCYPIVATHGNHENADSTMVQKVFDCESADVFYTRRFGELLSVTTLNTELGHMGRDEMADEQTAWLKRELPSLTSQRWQLVAYHRPMRPHTSRKPEGEQFYDNYARLFHQHGIDLIVESDTHMVKRTYPVRPSDEPGSSEGFIRDDATGTVFVGEGSWGAPRRPPDDDKPWTMASESFFQFKWIQVTHEDMQIRSVRFENMANIKPLKDGAGFFSPRGLKVWTPPTGEILRLPFDPDHPTFKPPPTMQPIINFGETWRWIDPTAESVADWQKENFDFSAWQECKTPAGYGEDGLATTFVKRPLSAYFQKSFTTPFKPAAAVLELFCDDGAVIYLNGMEVHRFNMPGGQIDASTRAASRGEPKWKQFEIIPDQLRAGDNVITASVHQVKDTSSDLVFDARLLIRR
jgi:hypothetical protein